MAVDMKTKEKRHGAGLYTNNQLTDVTSLSASEQTRRLSSRVEPESPCGSYSERFL